jgi:hypothetical protein
MCPFPPSDGHDFPGLIDELVPGLATQCDDFVNASAQALPIPLLAPVTMARFPLSPKSTIFPPIPF